MRQITLVLMGLLSFLAAIFGFGGEADALLPLLAMIVFAVVFGAAHVGACVREKR
jgi:hypothetical protein